MNNDWYSTYLGMIYPQNAYQDWEYTFSRSSMPELIEIASNELQKNIVEYAGEEEQKGDGRVSSFISTLEVMGAIQFISRSVLPRNSEREQILNITKRFEKTFNILSQEAQFLSEITAFAESLGEKWKSLVEKISKCLLIPSTTEYWDSENSQIKLYEGGETFEEFTRKARENPFLIPIMDYWEYLDVLFCRYRFSRIENLILKLTSTQSPFEDFKKIDDCFKEATLPSENIIDDSVKAFFPKEDYWWFYKTPRFIELIK